MTAKQFETWWDIDRVKPYPQNVKKHEPDQVKRIAESIQKFGWTTQIVVDKDGVIIAGHGRRLAAIHLNQTKVPVLVRDDLSEDEVKALRLADNRVAISAFDSDMLKIEMKDIDQELLAGIYNDKELKFFSEVDFTVIDDSKFVDDIEAAVETQQEETKARIAAVDEKDVPVAKALGFKSIKAKDEKHVARFMAEIEESTGKGGAEAFIEHCRGHRGG